MLWGKDLSGDRPLGSPGSHVPGASETAPHVHSCLCAKISPPLRGTPIDPSSCLSGLHWALSLALDAVL